MKTPLDVSLAPMLQPIAAPAAELDRLGDEIAELSAHLDAATARLLDLIRDFDARGKAEAEETTRRHRNRALPVYHDEDGMVIIRARLEPEAGAVVVQALASAREALQQRARRKDAGGGSAGPRLMDGSAGPRWIS